MEGWRRAQDKEERAAWAGDVMGEIDWTVAGRGDGLLGWRIGEVNALKRSLVDIKNGDLGILTAISS